MVHKLKLIFRQCLQVVSKCKLEAVKWVWVNKGNLRKEEFWASLSGFVFIAIVIVSLWAANFFIMPWLFSGADGGTANAGTAGDMFGGLTALFSGLAFAGLVTTLFMQRKELTLQRKELTLQRKELSQTRHEFRIQRFENTLFGLLKLLNDHINAMEISKSDLGYFFMDDKRDKKFHGRKGLKLYADELPAFKFEDKGEYNSKTGEYPVTQKTRNLVKVLDIYNDKYWKYYEENMGPYFRLIYNILRHIEKMDFTKESTQEEKIKEMQLKIDYAKILRAHLSSAEVKLLMYNCASVHGDGLKGWIEKYSMLRHIRRDDYTDNPKLVAEYEEIAFQWNERNNSSRNRG